MRIALDIDSTLHPYWEQLSAAARRRFGVHLPYAQQMDWSIPALRPEQLAACIADTHREEAILAARPYPGAVETVRRWHAAGHFIHVTSHRAPEAHDATRAATILHPWDREVCEEEEDVVCAGDWPGLERALAPMLAGRPQTG